MKLTILIIITLTLGASARVQTFANAVANCTGDTALPRKCVPTPELQELLSLVGLNVPENWHNLVETTQSHWLRQRGVERWQMPEMFTEKRTALLPIFRKLGLIDAVHAKLGFYEYAVVHGATLQGVTSRVNWLVSEWRRGIRFHSIVILSGERLLDEKHEMPYIFADFHYCEKIPTNETQMIQWLLPRIDMPNEMRRLPVLLVNAMASGTRARTGDTVMRWMNENPPRGAILAVSSQPYISYQDMSMRNRLAPGFSLETIGPAAGQVSNAVYLDNLARLLFELQRWIAR